MSIDTTPSLSWISWTAFLVVWLSCWIVVAAKAVAQKEGGGRIKLLQALLPAFAVTTLLGSFAVASQPQKVMSVIVLWLHHAAFLALFFFLAAGQFLQMEAWWNIRSNRFIEAGASYRRLWLLTVLLPAPVALTILLTGLRLIWEAARANPPAPGKSPATFWLLAILVGFSFFFADGILGYTPIVSKWHALWENVRTNCPIPDLDRRRPALADSLQLLLHFLFWPVVFLCGVYRWEIPNPASDFLDHAIHNMPLLPPGWPEVVVAMGIWATAGGIVASIRFLLRSKRSLADVAPALNR